MSQILSVFGATGQQGSSVINHVLQDPSLSSKFSICAITRDTTSPKSLQLPQAVEVAQADMSSAGGDGVVWTQWGGQGEVGKGADRRGIEGFEEFLERKLLVLG